MTSKYLCFAAFAMALLACEPASAYRYADYSAGRSFFSDGQQWTFRRADASGVESAYSINARVVGDTVISSYMDYYGDVVRVDQPCKAISVTTDEPGVPERRYAAYEWDAEVYVHSAKTSDFVQMLGFNKRENVKILYCGEKWSIDRVDYVNPHGRLLKRYACSGVGLGKSSKWIYRVGADTLWLNSNKWAAPGYLRMVNYYDPKDDATYLPQDFVAAVAVPDNKHYADGKQWVNLSAYDEKRGNEPRQVVMTVTGSEEADHIACKRVEYAIDGEASGHASTVCSIGDVMYERGYMDILSPRYDFSLKPGDMALEGVPESEVVGIDRLSVGGIDRKRIIFKGEKTDSPWKYWVEGIGGNGFNDCLPWEEIEDLMDMPEQYIPGTFVKCIEGGKTAFEQKDFSEGRSAIEQISVDGNLLIDANTPAYTLDGRRAAGLAPGRIVIIKGRKYLL